jgi:hypothetical protein
MSIWRRVYEDRRAVALPLVVALLVNVGVWLIGVLPLQTRLSAAEADTQLKAFYSTVLPADYATAVKTTNIWLQQAAIDAGLAFRSSRFDREPLSDSRLTRAYSTVSLTGRYADLRRFLHALETAEEFIALERVELIDANADEQGGGPIGIEIVVSTHFAASGAR